MVPSTSTPRPCETMACSASSPMLGLVRYNSGLGMQNITLAFVCCGTRWVRYTFPNGRTHRGPHHEMQSSMVLVTSDVLEKKTYLAVYARDVEELKTRVEGADAKVRAKTPFPLLCLHTLMCTCFFTLLIDL